MIDKAIVLAGGLGTRLRSVINDIPKPMADVNGKPFLEYVLRYLSTMGIKKVVLSVGYKHEIIINYFGDSFMGMELTYSIEKKPLGTGGAIKQSLKFVDSKNVFVLNGDTIFLVGLKIFYFFHISKGSVLSIALKKVINSGRYGTVEIDKDHKIKAFYEKQSKEGKGLINGGIYIINKEFFSSMNLPDEFSFEKDFLEKFYLSYGFYGLAFDNYFIDIGVPEDYQIAIRDLSIMTGL
jgi:D-glycero-alpha-D-manno-heptose 1-phosphate guanylyltransferase